jgi:hypothetical protein
LSTLPPDEQVKELQKQLHEALALIEDYRAHGSELAELEERQAYDEEKIGDEHLHDLERLERHHEKALARLESRQEHEVNKLMRVHEDDLETLYAKYQHLWSPTL